ncbi:MAG: response regulator [Patescibacteria group bacterium]|jgi:CheY-like chemotaxis protein
MTSEIKKKIPVKKTILVVEDEAPLQDAIKLKLQRERFRYLPATTAEEALTILEKEKPDLIWLDLLMPGMGGFAFLEKIRQNPAYRDLPVVIVSVSASPEKIRRAFELNVFDYLVKSHYKLDDIIKRIRGFIVKSPSGQSYERN